ncbi:FAS-associated factor 2-A-like isoform X2 [Artemia franciscana]|uniref:FAS-associated factor 2-A-like isoform X2 n=1 Tax=Artemia franciscana TaxID=6661 RepID=UPI0032DBBDB7
MEGEHQRDQILAHFQEASGIDRIEECNRILEQNNWNLEVALNSYLHNSVRDRPRQERENSPRRNIHYNSRSLVTRAFGMIQWFRSYQPQTTIGWIFYVTTLPIRMVVDNFSSIVSFVVSFFAGPYRPAITNVDEDMSSYKREFEEEFGAIHPNFFEGGYNQALAAAKRELVFLMVYIHSPDNQESKRFCQRTLTNPNVVNYINENFIFWSCSVKKYAGYSAFRSLAGSRHPFTGIAVLKNNKMSLASRIEEYLEPQPFVNRVKRVVENNEAFLIVARDERNERALNQTIRREQDEAFEESLRADREKEEKRQREREAKERLEKEIAEREMKEKEMQEELKERRKKAGELVPDEPDPSHSECVKVAVRLPDGRSLVRRFLRSHSLKYVYYFVFVDEESSKEFSYSYSSPI